MHLPSRLRPFPIYLHFGAASENFKSIGSLRLLNLIVGKPPPLRRRIK